MLTAGRNFSTGAGVESGDMQGTEEAGNAGRDRS